MHQQELLSIQNQLVTDIAKINELYECDHKTTLLVLLVKVLVKFFSAHCEINIDL